MTGDASAGNQLTIIHVVAPAAFGGLERVVSALASGQLEHGSEVHVMALLETGVAEPAIVAELLAAGVNVIRSVHPARSFRAQRADLLAACARLRPDIVHTHGYLPDVLAASLGRRAGVGRVTTVHGYTGGSLRNRIYEWMQRRGFRRLDAVVAVSAKLARELSASNKIRDKAHSIPNAWGATNLPMTPEEARAILELPSGRLTIGWVGRISSEKGLDVLIDSLPTLKDLPINLVVIGNGPDKVSLEKRATALGLDERITWLGQRGDAAEVLPAFDLVVISSRTEGTPMILFEAMHAGVPVIASAVGGIPDVVSPDEAVLVPSEDASRLALAIRLSYNSPQSRADRAERALERLRRDFAAGPWIETYDRLYRHILAARTTR